MPQITVYIRNEDMEKWKAIDKKSEWIHQRLNSPNNLPSVDTIAQGIPTNPYLPHAPSLKDYQFCTHNQVKGLCKKGCK